MVMKRWADACVEAFSQESGVGFLYSEVGDSAALIAARHGYTSAERDVLAALFSAFSTLALVLNSTGHSSIEINCSTDGAIGGFHIRISSRGEICGYLQNRVTQASTMQKIEDSEYFNFIFGRRAKLDVARFDDKGRKTDVFSMIDVSPWPDVLLKHCVEKYMKREAEVIVSFGNPNTQNFSHSIVILNSIGPRTGQVFKRLTSKESISKLQELLSLCPSLSAFRVELDLLDLISGPNLTIQPGCTCSDKDVKKQYEKVSDVEFKQFGTLVERTRTHELYCYEFRCHCCGKLYRLERAYPVEQA